MDRSYHAIVMGSSAGGLNALSSLLHELPNNYPIPIIITQHRIKDQRELLEEVLQHKCKIAIKQADEKEKIKGGFVYIAPPGYHLLIEQDRSFSLSSDDLASFSKPSIDVLFETAAEVFNENLVGLILTGANSDGTAGMRAIKKFRGLTIAQSPWEAQDPHMPLSAIKTGAVEHIWTLKEIQEFLHKLPPI